MIPGYNTNGFAHHRLEDALRILAELGYRAVAITPDIHHLDLGDPRWPSEADRVAKLLDDLKLHRVIETGARFVLDPRRKHRPTLLTADPAQRQIRIGYLVRCMDLAARVGAPLVSFWSGSPDPEDGDRLALLARLVEGCKQLSDEAAKRNLRIGFEPEPGMLIETTEQGLELVKRVDHEAFQLTIDVGHLQCMREPISQSLIDASPHLINVHFEDMKAGIHDHLLPGEGEIDLRAVLDQLKLLGYRGPVNVELSRHSHDAVATARKAMAYFHRYGVR